MTYISQELQLTRKMARYSDLSPKKFFWLHIKKSAGQSTRRLLQPHYLEVDRSQKPYCFFMGQKHEYNDILNNYRIPLGEYQFKRALFARDWLYKEEWDEMVSFAFCREPVSRCISAFFYLNSDLGNLDYAFDKFLDAIAACRASPSSSAPMGLHFSTHTASMWDDVTDNNGTILLHHIFRLEDLIQGINYVFFKCGLTERVAPLPEHINSNKRKLPFQPGRHHLSKIETLYGKDFDLYESGVDYCCEGY